MDDIKKMLRSIYLYTGICTTFCAIIAWVLFGTPSFIGVGIGAILGVGGFYHIVRFCQSINGEVNGKKAGIANYAVRYLVYGVVMFGFACLKIPVLSMLAGLLCHKGAILIYSIHTRKEMDDVSSK